MAALPEPRKFAAAVQSVRGEEPLLIGLIGPPGGGKTVSALRLATGMRTVRPGPVVLIDTEGGRSKKYSPPEGGKADPASFTFDFLRVEMTPPFRPHDFLAVIKAQLHLSPSAIIVDTMSEEHEGEGGFLDWHDQIANAKRGEAGYVGGNEWAAWAMPKAARKRLTSGLLQIRVPLLFTFRAREKTKTEPGKNGGRDTIVNIGFMPVAPLEIVHTLDLTAILPPRANGVPIWSSEKIGEDFIVKLPAFLAPLIEAGALSEKTGEKLARWAAGGYGLQPSEPATAKTAQPAVSSPAAPGGGQQGTAQEKRAHLEEINAVLTAHFGDDKAARADALRHAFGTVDRKVIASLSEGGLLAGISALRKNLEAPALMREPGEDTEES